MDKPEWYRARGYLHFDRPVGVAAAIKLVEDADAVARHQFFPLIDYVVKSKKVVKKNGAISYKEKDRPISYAAHRDSHIYSYYSSLLCEKYERLLVERGTGECVLAFRSLGKSNIDFAAEAFASIKQRGDCAAVALDISGFFDNLDHSHIKSKWRSVICEDRLPRDHFAVLRSITKFSTVSRSDLYSELGISPHNPKSNRQRVCSAHDFRKVVRGKGLIRTNEKGYGIPQGTPISATISNFYLLDFDSAAKHLASKMGGTYRRYCDDMLFIVDVKFRDQVAGEVRELLKDLRIDINTNKTEIRTFRELGSEVRCDKPLQYLGFLFYGDRVLIRSASLAKHSERMKKGVRLAKATMRKRNNLRVRRGIAPKPLFKKRLYERYSHLGERNFVRYGLRAAEVMESPAIKKQLKPLWRRLKSEIET